MARVSRRRDCPGKARKTSPDGFVHHRRTSLRAARRAGEGRAPVCACQGSRASMAVSQVLPVWPSESCQAVVISQAGKKVTPSSV